MVGVTGEIRLLRQIAHSRARLQEARAAVRFNKAGGDFQEGRFPGPVASHEADALARGDGEVDAVEQRRAAEAENDAAELN